MFNVVRHRLHHTRPSERIGLTARDSSETHRTRNGRVKIACAESHYMQREDNSVNTKNDRSHSSIG